MSAAKATKSKSKYDTTPSDITERADYPNGYYPNGEWAGFFTDEEIVQEWCAREKGRTYNWIPRPRPEPRVGVEKKKVRRIPVVVAKQTSRSRTMKSKPPTMAQIAESDRKVREAENIDWNVEDINDDAKMSDVAKKSQDAAIKKLKGKK